MIRKCFLVFVLVFVVSEARFRMSTGEAEDRKNSSVSRKIEQEYDNLEELSKALTEVLFTGRNKKGGGGGGMSMFFMRTLMDMFNATVPMMTMTVLGWMKDVVMMGSGALMMMMYDMLSKKGQEKKIIIKLSQPPPEPAPPAQTGYGPWEGR